MPDFKKPYFHPGSHPPKTEPPSIFEEGSVLSRLIARAKEREKENEPPQKRESMADLNRPKYSADAILPAQHTPVLAKTSEHIVAIGTSTGGTQALETVLTRLPVSVLGIVIVQHMPSDKKFMMMFTQRLNNLCQLEIREAKTGDYVRSGLALISPCGKHMIVKRSGVRYIVEVVEGPRVNRHKPSVDVLFRSVAQYAGENALGIIMTGMGDDGAQGLKEMRDAGAQTIAQDEKSCIVFGMPKEAIRLGAAEQVLPLGKIPEAIVAYSRKPGNIPG